MSQAKGQSLDHLHVALWRYGALRQRGHWHLMAYENNAWPFSKQSNLLRPRAVQ
jgi:hypothetical protein